jgi:hypothetical protein
MKRVRRNTNILHTYNTEYKPDSWDDLIMAAESELDRIRERSTQLTRAIEVFKKKKSASEPFAQSKSHFEQEQHAV